MAPSKLQNEPYIVISCEEDFEQEAKQKHVDPLYGPWGDLGSAKFSDPISYVTRQLRQHYPKHSIVAFDYVDVLGFPRALVEPIAPQEIISSHYFVSLARRVGDNNGLLIKNVRFGSFRIAWDQYDFILYVIRFLYGNYESSHQFLLHEGPEEVPRHFLLKAGVWSNALHEEIFVFDSGFWQKDPGLWQEVQKANWDDVILKDNFKKDLRKDVFGFFESEELYKRLAIPWKRGIIMHGPPGNGKTISMKAIMKGCDQLGYAPLYVKSFRSWKGDEGAMVDVFEKARQMSPCLLVLEDLDSLINDQNRSFFLNQLDGLESNDGILVIGTTNHLDRIDPALRDRPSRFDRKFLFDDPDKEERKLYVQYWQRKLESNKGIDFPDSLADEITETTDKFSFAYLKEAFVSTLVILAGLEDDDKTSFADVIRGQIRALRRQLRKGSDEDNNPIRAFAGSWSSPLGENSRWAARDRAVNQTFASNAIDHVGQSRFPNPDGSSAADKHNPGGNGRRDLKSMAMSAAALGRSYIF